MKAIITTILAAVTFISAHAYKYSYNFNDTPLSQALVQISKDNPDLSLSLIYNELHSYKTSASVRTDDTYEALRRTVGLNPVTIVRKGDSYYIEALQHGKYCYTGRTVDSDGGPVVAATVMLLAPRDSTVITYGITDAAGRFSIPCDRQDIVAKFTCVGFRPEYLNAEGFELGTIVMQELPVQLQTVKVEAANAQAYSDKVVYRPTERQKNASASATELLLSMTMPQIDVNPVTKSITTPSGQSVAVFIDFLEATPQDLASMLTNDVKRVEYVAFSKDPRFKGAEHVVNFVMQKYEWGGYTRVEDDQWFSVNRTEANLYSKFVYKRMTFDLYADEISFSNKHGGVDMTENMRFTDLYGAGPQEIERHTYTDSYRYRQNSNDITFRAVYNTETTQIANSLNFAIDNTPHNDETETVEYSGISFTHENTQRTVSSKNHALNYSGDFYHQFNDAVSLQSDASFVYGRNTLNSDYLTSDNLQIINNAVENAYTAEVSPRVEWNLNDSHSLSFSGEGHYQRHAIDYSGNSPSRQVYNFLYGMAGAGYDYMSKKFRVGTTLSMSWLSNDISGFKATNSFPIFEFHGVFTPNRKNQIQTTLNLGRYVPEAVNKSPNMLQQDALMWYTGSPDIKDNSTMQTRLNYTWLPNNRWNLGFNGQYYRSHDRVTAVYLPDGPNGTMLRKYMNSGNFHCGMLGLSGSVKLFGGRLALMARPQLWLRRSTGVYDVNNTDMVCQATATYYLGNFNLFAYYCTPSKYIEEEHAYTERTSSRYMLSAGWHHGPWHASVTAYNFLHNNWKAGLMTLDSRYYDYTRQEFNTNLHRRFSISLSYTFNYGKKVSNRDETSGSGTAESAILK